MRPGRAGRVARSRGMPDRPGSRRSIRTTSGRTSTTISSASSPVAGLPDEFDSTAGEGLGASAARIRRSSSTRTTVIRWLGLRWSGSLFGSLSEVPRARHLRGGIYQLSPDRPKNVVSRGGVFWFDRPCTGAEYGSSEPFTAAPTLPTLTVDDQAVSCGGRASQREQGTMTTVADRQDESQNPSRPPTPRARPQRPALTIAVAAHGRPWSLEQRSRRSRSTCPSPGADLVRKRHSPTS